MTQQPSYEFEEDEAPKTERKKFIPGLDEGIVAEGGAPSSQPVQRQVAKPGTGNVTRPASAAIPRPAPAAPAAAPDQAEDPDLKPGTGKDLWACPHCGTKNKPSRSECRACGKSPDAARDKPFWQKPAFLGGVIGGFALVLLLWFATRPDLSLKAPGATAFDVGSAVTTAERELVGRTFAPRGRISICGRILAHRAAPNAEGVQDVVLLLGKATEAQVDAAGVIFNNERIDEVPAGAKVLHLITAEKLDVSKGAWLSLVGDYGILSDGAQLIRSLEDGYTVAVEQTRQ
jgi:hypothetical protein